MFVSPITSISKQNWRDGVVVRASALQSVNLGFIPLVESYEKIFKMIFTASLLGAQHRKKMVWRTSRQACLLCPWARHLTEASIFLRADKWPTRTSLEYNCEVSNPVCRKR